MKKIIVFITAFVTAYTVPLNGALKEYRDCATQTNDIDYGKPFEKKSFDTDLQKIKSDRYAKSAFATIVTTDISDEQQFIHFLHTAPQETKNTLLLFAAQYNLSSIAELALNHGADIHAKNRDRYTALHHAAKHGNISLATLLLQKSAIIDDHSASYSPLINAVNCHQPHMIDFLLNHGAAINCNSENIIGTPLHWAAHKADYACVHLLLSRGAQINALNKSGETPLHMIPEGDHVKIDDKIRIMQLLIQAGVNIHQQNTNGLTALYNFVKSPNDLPAAQLLIDHGADVNATTNNGFSILHHAINYSNLPAVKLLLHYGADVNAITLDGRRPLHYVQQGCEGIAVILREHGAHW